jgi:hypothetical protein
LKISLAILMLAFAAAHVAGIWKLKAAQAANTPAPAAITHGGD